MKRDQSGISLVEVVLAVAIIAIAFTPLLGLFMGSKRSVDGAVSRTEAVAAGHSIMDTTLDQPWPDIITVPKKDYSADPRFQYEVIVVDSGIVNVKNITVRVYWLESTNEKSLELYSAVTRRD